MPRCQGTPAQDLEGGKSRPYKTLPRLPTCEQHNSSCYDRGCSGMTRYAPHTGEQTASSSPATVSDAWGRPGPCSGSPVPGSREASSPAGLTEQDSLGAVSRQSFLGGFDAMRGHEDEEGSVLFSREIWKKYKGTRPCWGLGPNIKPALLPGLSRTAKLRSFGVRITPGAHRPLVRAS